MESLAAFREAIDDFMGAHPQSPLDPGAQANFRGLAYFDPDPAWKLVVEVQRFAADSGSIEMATSTGDSRSYRRWGEFTFSVNGEKATLVVYSDDSGQELFLPFKDATNGRETYGAGRYLDNHRPGLQILTETSLELDFNFAYNPYCAYSHAYSCPLPPRENWLKVPIRAGEKAYHQLG